jgi:hypothetical protein
VLLWPFWNEASATFPATATSASLSNDRQHLAFVLLIEGYDLGFCTSDEVAALDTAWSAASEWTAIHGGLHMIGEVTHSAYPFDSSVDMPGMTFEITDAGDVLLPVAFRESSSTAIQERLADLTTATMDSNDTTLLMGDSSAFPASGTVYVGTEEITYTSNGGGGLLGGLTRGVRSLFGTAYGNNFGRPHEITFDSNNVGTRPMVSTEPRGLLGKNVGLYLCRKVDGTWTAGLPGSSSNDAECVWAGTIREIHDDGTGKVSLRCSSILELLKGSLLNQQYKGFLEEGASLTQRDGHGHFRVRTQVTTSAGTMDAATYPAAVNLLSGGGDGIYTASEIAELINAQLSTWFVTGGTFPSTQSLGLNLSSAEEGSNRYRWSFVDSSTARLVTVEIELHARVWWLLGWPQDGSGLIKHNSPPHYTLRMAGSVSFGSPAPNAPIRSTLRGGGEHEFAVTPSSTATSFMVQPNIPPALAQSSEGYATEGFLKIGGKAVVGVRVTGTNRFTTTVSDLGPYFTELGLPSVGNALEEALDYTGEIDGATGDGVVVEQVWLEIDKCSEVFRRLLLSTGTTGYNDLTYDVNPRQMGLGLPYKMVDVERSTSMLGRDPYVLYLDRATPVLRLLESAMQVRNLHATFRRGKLTIVGFGEDSTIAISLTESNKAAQLSPQGARIVERSVVTRTRDHIFNRLVFKYSVPFAGGEGKTITINNVDSQTEYGIRPVSIEALGIFEHVAGAGAVDQFVSRLTGGAMPYFGRPLGMIERSYDLSLLASLYPGAQVSITDSGIVSPVAGTRGVTDLRGWVLSTTFNYATGVGRCTILFQPENGVAHLGALPPSAKVDPVTIGAYDNGYDAATKKLLCKPHEYSGPADIVDVGRFAVGDKIHVVELSCSDPDNPTEFADTIAAIDTTANTITLTTGLSASTITGYTVTSGDFLVDNTFSPWPIDEPGITINANELYILVLTQTVTSGVAGDLQRAPDAIGGFSPVDPTNYQTTSGDRRLSVWYHAPSAEVDLTQIQFRWDNSVTPDPFTATVHEFAYSISRFTGVDATDPIVQVTVGSGSGTSLTVTLGAFASTANGAVLASTNTANDTTHNPEAGWTELYDFEASAYGVAPQHVQWRADNDTSATVSGVSTTRIGIALELRAAGGLAGKQFVVEYDDVSTVTSTQREDKVYLANTSHTTGYATNDELYYAGERGITAEGGVADAIDILQPYRRLASSGDDQGQPLSVHKYHETCDFANQYHAFHSAQNLVYWVPTSSAELLENTSTSDYKLLFGPVRLPLYGNDRQLRIQLYASSNSASGQSTVRVRTSTGLVRGTSATFLNNSTTPLFYPDGAIHTETLSLPASTGYAYSDILEMTPAVWQGDPPYCWLTIEGIAVSGGSCRIKGVFVWERFF